MNFIVFAIFTCFLPRVIPVVFLPENPSVCIGFSDGILSPFQPALSHCWCLLQIPPASGGLYRTNSGDIYRPPAAAEAQRPGGASSDLYRTPASADVYRPPVSTDVYRPPVSTEVYRPSASTDVYRPPTCTEVYRPAVSSDMYRAPGPSADLYRPSVSGPFSAPPPPPGYGAGRCLHTIPASSASSGSGGAAAEPALRESSPGASQRDSLAATEIICHSVCETALE